MALTQIKPAPFLYAQVLDGGGPYFLPSGLMDQEAVQALVSLTDKALIEFGAG
jgi:hypothetical protein